jgi:hypothetical protein
MNATMQQKRCLATRNGILSYRCQSNMPNKLVAYILDLHLGNVIGRTNKLRDSLKAHKSCGFLKVLATLRITREVGNIFSLYDILCIFVD